MEVISVILGVSLTKSHRGKQLLLLSKKLKSMGRRSADAHNLADTFNSHFSTVGADLANEISSRNNFSHLDYITKSNNNSELKITNFSEVFSLLTKLSKSKATGLQKNSS